MRQVAQFVDLRLASCTVDDFGQASKYTPSQSCLPRRMMIPVMKYAVLCHGSQRPSHAKTQLGTGCGRGPVYRLGA